MAPTSSAVTGRQAVEAIVPPRLPDGIDTPALVIDLDVAERNSRRLAGELGGRGITLRPHAKTHKSVGLARLQLDTGARGITVGNLGEAEVLAAGGIDDIFVAYPIWAEGPKAARLRALHDLPGLELAVGFDSAGGAERLAAAVAGSDHRLRVLLELDPGYHRTGVLPEDAASVARAAVDLGLEVVGLFTHGGHGYAGVDAVAGAASDEVRTLTAGRDALRAAGIEVELLSAGSTPTALGAAAAPVGEIRAGTYLVGDRQQVTLGSVAPDGIALWVAATVVSTATPGQVVVDAGAKTLTKDVAPYLDGHGYLPAYPAAVIEKVSDYHGNVRIPPGTPAPRLGEVVAIVPNHCCPVIDLRDSFLVLRDGEVTGTWPVDARGRSG
ncbi:MAG TPA: alanine racemase [Patescibacteria group bacterium]|nr:alanine racemase [Patescibacteria group bacterium]